MIRRLTFLLILMSTRMLGQPLLEGKVQDAHTQEWLVGAAVFFPGGQGTVTNAVGYFQLRVPPYHPDSLQVQLLGYESARIALVPGDSLIRVLLEPQVRALAEVQILDPVRQRALRDPNLVHLPMEQVKNFPVLFGEADPLKFLQSLPGVLPGREGSSQLHVRGGGPNQNLFLIEGMPMFSIEHVGGLLSVLDPHSLKDLRLYKGGFPARYGGRLSSVLDIKLKDGNKKTWRKYLDVGLIATRFAAEGPIKADTSSVYVSLRRANTDLYTSAILLLSDRWGFRAGYTFYDLTTKMDYRLSARDQLTLTFYGGLDRTFVRSRTESEASPENQRLRARGFMDWANGLAVANWNRTHKRHFRNVMVGYSQYALSNRAISERTGVETETNYAHTSSLFRAYARDWRAGVHYERTWGTDIQLRYGAEGSYQQLLPGQFVQRQFGTMVSPIDEQYGAIARELFEMSPYAQMELLYDRWRIEPGLRMSYWPNVETLPGLEPRLQVSYEWANEVVSVSATRMRQSLHLLSNNTPGIPIDLWVPATRDISPMRSWQYTLGYTKDSDWLLFQLSTYYKTYRDLIEFADGNAFFGSRSDWSEKVSQGGRGNSYGVEALLRKKSGRLNGWLSYTYSRSWRQFEDINEGFRFPYRYDRPHYVATFVNYHINERVSLGANWFFASGDALTMPQSQYPLHTYDMYADGRRAVLAFDQFTANTYGPRNDFRAPSSHRLDVNLAFEKQRKNAVRIFRLGAYNVYNRINPFYLYFDRKPSGQLGLFKASFFPLMPFVAWNVTY